MKAFQQLFDLKESPFLTAKVMDILFDGVGINCDLEDLEASIVCQNLESEKSVTKINDTYYAVSIFGSVRFDLNFF